MLSGSDNRGKSLENRKEKNLNFSVSDKKHEKQEIIKEEENKQIELKKKLSRSV